jgi:hypothetical protein
MTDTPQTQHADTLLAGVAEVFALVIQHGARWQELAMFNASDSPAAVIRLHSPGELEHWLDAQQIKPHAVSDGRRTRLHARIGDVLVTWPAPITPRSENELREQFDNESA